METDLPAQSEVPLCDLGKGVMEMHPLSEPHIAPICPPGDPDYPEHPPSEDSTNNPNDSRDELLPRTNSTPSDNVVFIEPSSSDSESSTLMGNHVSSYDSDRMDPYLHNIIHETTTSEYV